MTLDLYSKNVNIGHNYRGQACVFFIHYLSCDRAFVLVLDFYAPRSTGQEILFLFVYLSVVILNLGYNL